MPQLDKFTYFSKFFWLCLNLPLKGGAPSVLSRRPFCHSSSESDSDASSESNKCSLDSLANSMQELYERGPAYAGTMSSTQVQESIAKIRQGTYKLSPLTLRFFSIAEAATLMRSNHQDLMMVNPKHFCFENYTGVLFPTRDDQLVLTAFSRMLVAASGIYGGIKGPQLVSSLRNLGYVNELHVVCFESSLGLPISRLLSTLEPYIGQSGPLYDLVLSFFDLPLLDPEGNPHFQTISLNRLCPIGSFTFPILDLFLKGILDPFIRATLPNLLTYRVSSNLLIPVKSSVPLDFPLLQFHLLQKLDLWFQVTTVKRGRSIPFLFWKLKVDRQGSVLLEDAV